MWFKYLSACCILIPIIAGWLKYKPASNIERLVLFFLMFGLLTDATFLFTTAVQRESIMLFYSLAESVFFAWFIFKTSGRDIITIILKTMFFSFPLLWIAQCVVTLHMKSDTTFYEPFYLAVISFTTGFALLFMTEQTDAAYRKPLFWFMLGIFFYSFCTFFILSFIRDEFAQKIWFIHDIINMITYLIYTEAFLSIKRADRQ